MNLLDWVNNTDLTTEMTPKIRKFILGWDWEQKYICKDSVKVSPIKGRQINLCGSIWEFVSASQKYGEQECSRMVALCLCQWQGYEVFFKALTRAGTLLLAAFHTISESIRW